MMIHTGHLSIDCLKGSYIRADYIPDRLYLVLLDSPILLHHGLLLIFRQQASG